MKEEKFYDRVKDSVIFKTTENKFVSLPEYLGEKAEGNVFYTNEEEAHSYYVSLYTEKSLQVLVLNKLIDTNFAQFLESKNSKVKFKRIDSNLSSIGNESGKNDDLSKIFEAASGKKAEDISFVSLKSEDAPALISIEEDSRRMNDMMKMYGMGGDMPTAEKLVINTESEAVKRLLALDDET
ncbi:MAG: molecular chaperone HtpG, partial [Clostridia bacterium]